MARKKKTPLTHAEFTRRGHIAFLEKTTPAQRSENAAKAVNARWAKYRAAKQQQTSTAA